MARRIRIYQDAVGEYRYQAKAANGRIVGTSEEGFKSRAYAEKRAIEQFPRALVEHEPDRAKP